MNLRPLLVSAAAGAAVLVATVATARADHGWSGGIEVVFDVPTVTYANSLPPSPRVEYVPPRPAGSYTWVEGYWHWDGYQWIWVSGRWVRPRPGYVYAKPYYEAVGSHCVYASGYFTPKRRAHVTRRYVRRYRHNHDYNRPRRSWNEERRYRRTVPRRTVPPRYRGHDNRRRDRRVERSERYRVERSKRYRVERSKRARRGARVQHVKHRARIERRAKRQTNRTERVRRRAPVRRRGGAHVRDHRRR